MKTIARYEVLDYTSLLIVDFVVRILKLANPIILILTSATYMKTLKPLRSISIGT
ncbi:hypothetical protein [Sphingobacterium sp. LRF_L2]|uniref:hypothetical protein n=1 Tax=Sphingobacterium sp. LRF_L2 TaxID=3369421 RepID=UPI003F63DD84